MAAEVRVDVEEVRRHFQELEDPCSSVNILHSVSVWASEFGLTLAQVATDEKSNEITAIPELLSLIDIHGAIITIDAMGAQTAIAEKIVDGGGDYVLALKGNQETLHEAVIDYLKEQTKTDFRGIGARRMDKVEKKHGRVERSCPHPGPLPTNFQSVPGEGIYFPGPKARPPRARRTRKIDIVFLRFLRALRGKNCRG
jgi:predicted transposase YbfD/YdcC